MGHAQIPQTNQGQHRPVREFHTYGHIEKGASQWRHVPTARAHVILSSLKEPPEPHPLWDEVPSWLWVSLGKLVVFATTHCHPKSERLCEIEAFLVTQDQLSILQITDPLMRLD
jgi:hypothetical protein